MVALGHGAHVAPAVATALPQRLRQVWRWFNHLHATREFSRLTEPVAMPDGRLGWQVKAKAMPLSPVAIEAWARLSAVEIAPWQYAGLLLIDAFYVKTTNDPPPVAVAANAENLLTMFRALGMKAKKG